jgi:8-oxo-dGTP pyrophosphatase MutT (NUDIX family)
MNRAADIGAIRNRLAARLKEPLPGRAAQEPHSVEMSFGRHFGPPRCDARSAAVMALLCCDAAEMSEFTLPLIVRPSESPSHGGQVSLPGGAVEEGETLAEAALRELNEELGIREDEVHVVGSLSPLYVFSSNHYLTPVLGLASERPAFRPSAREVARVLQVPISYLADNANRSSFERQFGDMTLRAPCWHWDGEPIWGTTAMVLAELVAAINGVDFSSSSPGVPS